MQETRKITIPAEPTVDQMKKARQIVRQAGVDPTDVYAVAQTCAFAASDNSPKLLRAFALVASQMACPMNCGRKLDITHKDSLGIALCPECMTEAETENAHSDGHHADEPDASCPACQEMTPTPDPAPAGSIVTVTDAGDVIAVQAHVDAFDAWTAAQGLTPTVFVDGDEMVDAAEEAHFQEWGAEIDAAEAHPTGTPLPQPAVVTRSHRGGRTSLLAKYDDCPNCGFHFTKPAPHCQSQKACDRRAAARKAA